MTNEPFPKLSDAQRELIRKAHLNLQSPGKIPRYNVRPQTVDVLVREGLLEFKVITTARQLAKERDEKVTAAIEVIQSDWRKAADLLREAVNDDEAREAVAKWEQAGRTHYGIPSNLKGFYLTKEGTWIAEILVNEKGEK